MDRRDTAFEGALLICSNGDRELERIRFFWSLQRKMEQKYRGEQEVDRNMVR